MSGLFARLSQSILSSFWEEERPGFFEFPARLKQAASWRVRWTYYLVFAVFVFSPWLFGVGGKLWPFLSVEQKRKILARMKGSFYPFRLVFIFVRSASLANYEANAPRALVSSPAAPFEGRPDFIVVGSGAGGGVVACRLAEAGKKVLVIEAGARIPDVGWQGDLLSLQSQVFRDWGLQSARSSGGARIPLLQAKTVGGTGAISGRILHRLPDGWLKRHSRENFQSEQDLVLDELGIAEGSSNSDSVQRSLAGLGWEVTAMARAFHSPAEYLARAERAGAEVRSGTEVRFLRREGRRITGVELANGETIAAQTGVVLAAGALHTPWLLWRSGIRPAALGLNFGAHLSLSVLGVGDGNDPRLEVLQFAESGIKLASQSGPWELLLSRHFSTGPVLRNLYAERSRLSSWMATIVPEKTGRLQFARRGPRPFLPLGESDLVRCRFALLKLSRLLWDQGVRQLTPGLTCPWPAIDSEAALRPLEDLPLDARAFFLGAGHLFGGASWGDGEAESVVDREGRVWGWENLWIGDASVFPAPTGVNPLLGLLAVGSSLGSRLSRR